MFYFSSAMEKKEMSIITHNLVRHDVFMLYLGKGIFGFLFVDVI